jgi:hypothetical protein
MTPEQDTRDRVIRLEAELDALTKSVEQMANKVTEMHELLLRAKGAKYIIVGSAAIGGFLSAKMAHYLPWMGGNP